MKKIVAIMLVLAALSTSVFAGDSYLGLTLAPEFEFGFQDETYYGGLDITEKKDFSNGYFGIGAVTHSSITSLFPRWVLL